MLGWEAARDLFDDPTTLCDPISGLHVYPLDDPRHLRDHRHPYERLHRPGSDDRLAQVAELDAPRAISGVRIALVRLKVRRQPHEHPTRAAACRRPPRRRSMRGVSVLVWPCSSPSCLAVHQCKADAGRSRPRALAGQVRGAFSRCGAAFPRHPTGHLVWDAVTHRGLLACCRKRRASVGRSEGPRA